MLLQGLVLSCPLTPSRHCCILSFDGGVWRVRSYGLWYRCAPSLPPDNAVFSRFDGGVEGMILRGLYCCAPFTPP